MKAIINARIYDFEHYIENGYVRFDETIQAVGSMSRLPELPADTFDAHGMLLMPSLVCAHTHLYSAFARGLSLPFDPHNFKEILEQIWWRIDSKIDNEITFASAIVAGSNHLKNGVTTLFDHHASGTEISGSLGALKRALVDTLGMRAGLCFETSDRFPVEAALAENLSLGNESTPTAASLFGLHASLSLSDDTLQKIAAVRGDKPIHIHVAESRMDEDDSLKKSGLRVVERLAKAGLLSRDALLVHCVHVDDAELDLIKESGAVVALNPSSNMNNGVGIADYSRMRTRQIPVIIGNDGLYPGMAQEYVNLLLTQHLRAQDPRAFSLVDLKQVIDETYRYASRRLRVKLGRIQPGFAADLLLHPYSPSTPMSAENAMSHLFYGVFGSFTPSHVYAGGNLLIDDYRFSAAVIDSRNLATAAALKLWQRL